MSLIKDELIFKGVPVQDVCIRSCLPMWAVMFVCLCACSLVWLVSVGIATVNANVLFWETPNPQHFHDKVMTLLQSQIRPFLQNLQQS